MGYEYGTSGKEFSSPKEVDRLPGEFSAVSDEVSRPAKEHQLSEQFGSSISVSDKDSKKKEQHRKHKKTVRKMVYALASAAMVVTLAETTKTIKTQVQDEPMGNAVGSIGLQEYSQEHGGSWHTFLSFDLLADGTIHLTRADQTNEKEAYELIEGISFDGITNTLYIEDYDVTAFSIGWNDYETPLTVCVEGENRIGHWYFHGIHFNLEGDGSIRFEDDAATSAERGSSRGSVQFYSERDSEGMVMAVPRVRVADTIKVVNREYNLGITFPLGTDINTVEALADMKSAWGDGSGEERDYGIWLGISMENENFNDVVEALTLGSNES